MPRSSLLLPALSQVVLVACLGGCAGLGSRPNLNAELSKSGSGPAAAEQTAKFEVVFQPENGKTDRVERSLSEPVTVQQALEQTRAIKKFRRIEVELVRQLPSGGFHKIPCEYDRSTKRINPEFDYALMPGDKVIVKEDTTTIFDDILHSAGGGIERRFNMKGQTTTGGRYRLEG